MAVIRVTWQLVAEVLDHAPAKITAAERVVLLAIAEYVQVGRTWTGKQAELARRAGLSHSTMRGVLAKLAEHGADVRVPISTDRRGTAVYAVPGRSPTFRVPVFAPAGCTCETCRKIATGAAKKGALDNAPSVPEGAPDNAAGASDDAHRCVGQRGQPRRTTHPLQAKESKPAAAAAVHGDAWWLAERIGISSTEADALIADKLRGKSVDNVRAYLAAIPNGDLRTRSAELSASGRSEAQPMSPRERNDLAIADAKGISVEELRARRRAASSEQASA